MTRKSGGGSPVKIIASHGKEAVTDYTAGALVGLTFEHHEIHEGDHYYVEDNDMDVDTGVPKLWLLIVPDTARRIHWFMEGFSDGGGWWRLYENPTVTLNGTALVPINNDRDSLETATLDVYRDPTIGALGTQIGIVLVPSAGRKEGGSTSRDREILLGRGKMYVLQFTSLANDTMISMSQHWYEHTP